MSYAESRERAIKLAEAIPDKLRIYCDGDFEAVRELLRTHTRNEIADLAGISDAKSIINYEKKYDAFCLTVCRYCNKRKTRDEMYLGSSGRIASSHHCLECRQAGATLKRYGWLSAAPALRIEEIETAAFARKVWHKKTTGPLRNYWMQPVCEEA